MNISFSKTFYLLATVFMVLLGLYFGRPVFTVAAAALLLSFIIYPVVSKIESWGVNRIFASFIGMFGLLALIGLTVYLFSNQIINMLGDFSNFQSKMTSMFQDVIGFLNEKVPIIPEIKEEEVMDAGKNLLKDSGLNAMSVTMSSVSTILSGAVLVIVFTFLLLIYRGGLKKVLVSTAAKEHESKMSDLVTEVQKVGQQYLFGMGILILILGVANSTMLFIFGLDHPVLFGFLAALLAIIPYVGTTIGAAIPVLFAIFTKDSIWIPIGIAASFAFIQIVESNFISPKVVGGNLKINALAAILALFIGGYLWGIAGMVLFLPLAAIFKVFCEYFTQLKPVALLMSDEIYEMNKGKNFPINFKIKKSK